MSDSVRIDFDRLLADIHELSEIGSVEGSGLYRTAFSDADMEARDWLKSRMEDAGLEVRQDGAANVFGRLGDRSDEPVLLVGSHIDTVPAGGHLDGTLGVLVALESLRRIREEGLSLSRPLEMVAFSDEEGRFGPPLGSRAMVGDLTRADIYDAVDLEGVRLADAMAQHGLDAQDALTARRTPDSIEAYLELHIEQGPVLEELGCQVGVVTSFAGLFRWRARLLGDADHAGTTPMNLRQDAFLGLAEFAGQIPRVLEEHGSDDSVATIGMVRLQPGSANTVPGTAEFSIDARDPDPEVLTALAHAFRRVLSALARRRSLMFEFEVLSEIEPVACDQQVVGRIEEAAEHLGVRYHRMISGAIHDAQIVERLAPVGMIFVPSKDGRSHSPMEWTHWDDIEVGANVTLQTLIHLAGSPNRTINPNQSRGIESERTYKD